MKYDFDKVLDRYNTYSVKYDFAAENGKRGDIMPFWIADMDICTCPEVIEAIKQGPNMAYSATQSPRRSILRPCPGGPQK